MTNPARNGDPDPEPNEGMGAAIGRVLHGDDYDKIRRRNERQTKAQAFASTFVLIVAVGCIAALMIAGTVVLIAWMLPSSG